MLCCNTAVQTDTVQFTMSYVQRRSTLPKSIPRFLFPMYIPPHLIAWPTSSPFLSRCPPGIIAGCDLGVLASPAGLTVYACAASAMAAGVTHPLPYNLVGPAYCRVNSSNPGSYKVTCGSGWNVS